MEKIDSELFFFGFCGFFEENLVDKLKVRILHDLSDKNEVKLNLSFFRGSDGLHND